MAQDHEAFIRSMYDWFNEHKRFEEERWHPDGEYVNSREDPDHDTYRGKAVPALYKQWVDAYPDLTVEPLEVVVNGDRVFAWTHWTGHGAASDAPMEMWLAHVWTIEDGRIRRAEEYNDRAEGRAVAGLPA